MASVVVTGGSGKAGKACVRELQEHGWDVFSVDSVLPEKPLCPHIAADLADYGQAVDALCAFDQVPHHVDAVLHLAAIPAPRRFPNPTLFRNNTLSTYNVFEACRRLQIKNIVWASSETVLGVPFDRLPPYIPVDEEYPGRPESAYSLSKLMGEEMAKQFCRWDPDLKILSLRFSNILDAAECGNFPQVHGKPGARKWNFWGYIETRDAARAARLALESKIKGSEIFIIANADTCMERPNQELLDEVFPGIKKKRDFGPHETLLSIEKAKKMLGFEPKYTWRKEK